MSQSQVSWREYFFFPNRGEREKRDTKTSSSFGFDDDLQKNMVATNEIFDDDKPQT